MIIKLVCDDSCGFVRRLGASEMHISWAVEPGLPLQDAAHIVSLNAAINENRCETVGESPVPGTAEVSDFRGYKILVAASCEPLDPQRTPQELGLSGGDTLRLVPAAEGLQTESQISPAVCRSLLHEQEEVSQQDENTEDESDKDNGESYMSREIGWFPFLLRPREGEPLVLFNDPFQQVHETDPEPMVQPLCERCCTIVSHGDALRVEVDMHCKPKLIPQEFLEVCMEKLGGGRLRRWQTRYVRISDKSVDWFAERLRPGVKSRIHGHRSIEYNGECQIEELISDPDPVKYTHCSDKKFFHFGVVFRNPTKTYFFRVTTEQQRTKVLEFLALCIKRAKEKVSSCNPVTWKQHADALLVNAAQVGELHSCNRMNIEMEREKLRALEEELEDILQEKPKLQAALSSEASYVQSLRAELTGYETDIKKMQQCLMAAEARLAEEMQLLRTTELEMNDEIRKVELLKSHALMQRDSAKTRIEELRDQVNKLQEEETAVFRRWRSLEERYKQPLDHTSLSDKMYSFSRDGVGTTFSTPRLSLELAASAARLALSEGAQCSASPSSLTTQCSPSRALRYPSASPKQDVRGAEGQ